MYIYLADLNTFDIEKLKSFSKKSAFKNLKEKQHYLGLYIVNYVCKNLYSLNNPEIEYINNKPFIKNANIFISISHSKNLVAVGFSDDDIGIDAEYNKREREFLKILTRYKNEFGLENLKNFNDLSKDEQFKIFYDFWTLHEAKIKLNNKNKDVFYLTTTEVKDFTISVACEKKFENIKIVKTLF